MLVAARFITRRAPSLINPLRKQCAGEFLGVLTPSRVFSNESRSTAPVSRKKKRGLTKVVDEVPFAVLGKEMLKTIEAAIEDVISLNPGYSLNHHSEGPEGATLDCGEHGSYVFKLDFEREFLVVSTPISGTLEYFYDNINKDWLNVRDGHHATGIITRDLLRHARGSAQFRVNLE